MYCFLSLLIFILYNDYSKNLRKILRKAYKDVSFYYVMLMNKKGERKRIAPVVFLIAGILLMVTTPIFKITKQITLSGFVIGMLLAFIGLFLFLEW